jgi:magnesium-transporting ATPase (P-type)
MSVQDPTTMHHPDNLQQEEGIPSGIVVWVIVISSVVSVIGGFIAWVLLIFFFGEVRPNQSVYDYPERNLGNIAGIKDLAIEQEFFELPVQPGEKLVHEQKEALQAYGPNKVQISIKEAKKRFLEKEKGK